MPKHPAWDIYESALLLDICLCVERGEMEKKAAIKKLSATLRRTAGRNDNHDTYRNEAGISWQYNYMKHLITCPDYEHAPKIFREIARLYREEPEKYAQILREAKRVFSVE